MVTTQSSSKNRPVNILLGLTLAFGFIFISFEYTWKEQVNVQYTDAIEVMNYVEEAIPVTTRKQHLQKQRRPPAPLLNVYTIVDEDISLPEDILELIDASIDPDPIERAPIEAYDPLGDENPESGFFQVVEQMPKFPGGSDALLRYLNEQIKYPKLAVDYGIAGRVYIQFIVSKTGEITKVQLVKGVHQSLDEEALRVVKSMPRWIPGEQRGKKVAVQFSIPITFTLN